MIGRADHDGVDLLVHLGQHLAEVAELLRLRELLKGLGRATLVDVAQRDDILLGHAGQVRRPSPTAADDGHVQLLVGRDRLPRGVPAAQPEPDACQGGVPQQLSAVEPHGHDSISFEVGRREGG